MTTWTDRRRIALLVVDMQNKVVDGTFARDEVVARIATLADRARETGASVIWVQHSGEQLIEGSGGWCLVPELEPRETEPVVHKRYGDAFEATDLEQLLAQYGVGCLVVAGAETDACIRSTIHGAFTRGYDVTLVSDAHTAQDKTEWGAPPVPQVIAHTNLYWSFQEAPGRTARVVPAAEVRFDAQAEPDS